MAAAGSLCYSAGSVPPPPFTRILALLVLAPNVALAGGFEIPDRGTRALGRAGATAVGVTDPTALHYNPGALSRLSGTRVLWHHNLILHETTFQRDPISAGWGGDAGTTFDLAEDGESFFPLGAFIAVSSDLGLTSDWTFAAGLYGPSGVGKHDYEDYGPQSYMLTEMEAILVYYSLAAAWSPNEDFGVGLTLQWVDMPMMEYELVVNGTSSERPNQLQPVPVDSGTLLKTRMVLSDRMAFSGIAGVWWRPAKWLETGLAGRFMPIGLEPEGGVETDKPTLITDDLTAHMALDLPMTARGGIRYLHYEGDRRWFDVELDVFWENWSTFDAFDVKLDGAISGQEVKDLSIPKAWQDSVSVRLGSGINLVDEVLEVSLGALVEEGAVPDNYTHLDYPSFDRLGLATGVVWDLGGYRLSASYMHIFQETRTVTESRGKQFQQRPLHPCPEECEGLSGVVANAGTFESSYDLFSIGLEVVLGAGDEG